MGDPVIEPIMNTADAFSVRRHVGRLASAVRINLWLPIGHDERLSPPQQTVAGRRADRVALRAERQFNVTPPKAFTRRRRPIPPLGTTYGGQYGLGPSRRLGADGAAVPER